MNNQQSKFAYLENETLEEFTNRANKCQFEWPKEDREYHQRNEDKEVTVMILQGLSDLEIDHQLEQDKKMQWPPGRVR